MWNIIYDDRFFVFVLDEVNETNQDSLFIVLQDIITQFFNFILNSIVCVAYFHDMQSQITKTDCGYY